MSDKTSRYGLHKPPFLGEHWQAELDENWENIDRMLTGTATGGADYPPAWKWDFDLAKATPDDPPDDEFGQDAGGLDAQWTVVDGASGSVSLLGGGGGTYDLTTIVGKLLVQVDNGNHVKLRQDYTLGDGASIILCIYPTLMSDGETGIGNNELWIGLALNDNDTDFDAGEYSALLLDTQAGGWRVMFYDGAVKGGTGDAGTPTFTHQLYLRLHRSGSDIYAFWSTNGLTWMPLSKDTRAATATNLWIFVEGNAAFGDPTPIQAIDWIRLGDANILPWTQA